MSPRDIVKIDQHGRQIIGGTDPLSSHRSQDEISEDRVRLLPATDNIGTNTTGSQVANLSNTMKQKSSMITTITGSKAPTTVMASKHISAETIQELD